MKDITIGVLGGTFDPPHNGHLAMARAVLESGKVDHVWLLPCWKHAFGKKPVSFEDRVVMCVKATKDEPDVSVCADEGTIQSTYSIEILTYLNEQNPDKNIRLIMGADNYWKMDMWENKEKVFELANPIWVERPSVNRLPDTEETVHCHVDVSSTLARNTIAEFNIHMNELVHPDVKDHIAAAKLYRR